MQFQSSQDAEERLKNPAQLKPEEIDALFEWMHQITETGVRRLNAHLALKNLQAMQKFRTEQQETDEVVDLAHNCPGYPDIRNCLLPRRAGS